jgi:hypothetical protein
MLETQMTDAARFTWYRQQTKQAPGVNAETLLMMLKDMRPLAERKRK